jgi:hypothetical protein
MREMRASDPKLDPVTRAYGFVVKDEKLLLRRRRSPDRPLSMVAADIFIHDDLGLIRFLRGKDKKVNGATLTTGRVRRIRFERR